MLLIHLHVIFPGVVFDQLHKRCVVVGRHDRGREKEELLPVHSVNNAFVQGVVVEMVEDPTPHRIVTASFWPCCAIRVIERETEELIESK